MSFGDYGELARPQGVACLEIFDLCNTIANAMNVGIWGIVAPAMSGVAAGRPRRIELHKVWCAWRLAHLL
eukprot:6151407-Lingulodinium_polyedra.AAC.1